MPHVWSVEALADLAGAARERLHGLGYSVEVRAGDGRLGWPEHAPYDGIIVTAAALDVPPHWLRILPTRAPGYPGGRDRRGTRRCG